ncbi:MAG: EAL domain-containing protein, partial [Pseudomonadota bacterium]
GFDGGDKLLQSITNILSTYLPENAHLARTGDDEFAVLMPQSSIDRSYQVAETHRQAIDEFRYSWDNQLIPVSASVGIVAVNDTSMTSVDLLKAASSACSIAKQAGRNCTRIYRSTDQAFVEHKQLIKTVAGIEHALENNRIQLMAQLIEPLQDQGESSHYEILLRVVGKDDELQSPFQFIQAAEQYDLMRAVDRWVVNHFFAVVHEKMDQIEAIGGFSINLSSQTIADNEFKDYLKEQIESSPIPNEKLGFEITETAMLKDAHDAITFIEEIREMGCGFYLDDFGSGYASFSYLKDLPVDYVKIDGIFIKDLRTDHASKAMVTSVTDIAHFMGRKVVAEFVEDAETAEALKKIGVDFIQGYYIGRPSPLEDLFFSKSDTDVIDKSDRIPLTNDLPSPS